MKNLLDITGNTLNFLIRNRHKKLIIPACGLGYNGFSFGVAMNTLSLQIAAVPVTLTVQESVSEITFSKSAEHAKEVFAVLSRRLAKTSRTPVHDYSNNGEYVLRIDSNQGGIFNPRQTKHLRDPDQVCKEVAAMPLPQLLEEARKVIDENTLGRLHAGMESTKRRIALVRAQTDRVVDDVLEALASQGHSVQGVDKDALYEDVASIMVERDLKEKGGRF